MTYTLHQISTLGLIKAKNGEPIYNKAAIKKRLADRNIMRTAMDKRGNSIYQVTIEQINEINKQ